MASISLWDRVLSQSNHEQCVSLGTTILVIDGNLTVFCFSRMNVIIRIITGALQDADNDSYRRAVRVYLFQAVAATIAGLVLLIGAAFTDRLALLQWTRKYRLAKGGPIINALKERSLVTNAGRNNTVAIACFGLLFLLIVGSWAAYIWGAVTGHNS
jgi:hypothetical protein